MPGERRATSAARRHRRPNWGLASVARIDPGRHRDRRGGRRSGGLDRLRASLPKDAGQDHQHAAYSHDVDAHAKAIDSIGGRGGIEAALDRCPFEPGQTYGNNPKDDHDQAVARQTRTLQTTKAKEGDHNSERQREDPVSAVQPGL